MALPTLTPEQRAASLAKATQARARRAQLLGQVKSGVLTVADFVALDDDVARKTRVATLLLALPGYGKVKATALREAVDIAENRKVGGLTDKKRAALLEALAA